MRLELVQTLWRDAGYLKRLAMVAAPVVVLAALAAGITFAAASGGDGPAEAVVVATETPTHTAVPPTPTPTPPPTATPQPPPSSGGGGGGGGSGSGSGGGGSYRPPASGSGPGAIQGTGMSLSVPAAGINASVYSRTVGTNGVMGNPAGAWDVIWYDFSQNFPGLGGYPGEPGANAVFAGHVDYIRVGPAVFWGLRDLQPGATVTVNTPQGAITYSVQWSRWAEPYEDFTQFVAQTGQDVITLVTCIGGFSGGHYSNRLIVRGVRI